MARSQLCVADPSALSFSEQLREIGLFFEGRDQVHKTFRRLIKRLEQGNIAYAIVGAMALAAHRYRRATTDVDILLTAGGFARFQKLFVTKYYDRIPGRKRRFVDKANRVNVDILVTGLYPGTGQPGPISYPNPLRVREK